MSRRQTLGVLSPSQLNSRSNAPARVASKESQQGSGLAGAGGKARKSLAPDKAAMILMAAGASMSTSVGAGQSMGAPAAAFLGSSMAGSGIDPRRSSAFNGKAMGPKADPRPITDKNFQANCMRTVITYLSTHGYAASVSPKTLASPTAKDFTMIVQFLQQQFDPNLKTFGKIEDDVPLFFKRLNYPFQISKSALFAVGSPHSWPAVLAALTWLVELLNYNERIEGLHQNPAAAPAGGPGIFEDQEATTKRQFFEYICTSYKHFLSGDDAKTEAVDQEMLSQFGIKEQAIAEAHAAKQLAHDQLLAEIQRLKTEPSPLAAAQQRRAERAADAEKFQQLIENLQGMKSNLMRKISERQEELSSRQEAMRQTVIDNQALRARIAAQPLNKADLARMVLEKNKQKEVLDAVSSHAEELEHKLHQQEVQLVAKLKSLEAAVAKYNQMAHRLKLVPASAKRADGVTFELRTNRDATTPSEFSNVDLKSVIKPGLEHLCEVYRTKAAQLGRDLVSHRETAASSSDALHEKAEENKALEAMISKLESQLQGMRESREERVRAMAGQAESLQDEVSRLRSAVSHRAADVEARKTAVLAEYEALQRNCEADLAKLRVELRTALEGMLQHHLHCQQVVGSTLATVQQAQMELQQVVVPS